VIDYLNRSGFSWPRWVERKNMAWVELYRTRDLASTQKTRGSELLLEVNDDGASKVALSRGVSKRTVKLRLAGGTRAGILVTTSGGVRFTSLISSAAEPLFLN